MYVRRCLGRKVDRYLAVLPQRRNAERVAILAHRSRALRHDGVAGSVVAGTGVGRNGHAPLCHGAALRCIGVRRQSVAVKQRPAGIDVLQLINIAVAGIEIIRGDNDRECGAAALRLIQRRQLITAWHTVGLTDLR